MHIEKLSLFNFKNYEEVLLTFSTKVNCLVGENGSGKTNLLDAIHYLSLTKSAFNTVDTQNIRFGADFFSIHGVFVEQKDRTQAICSFQDGSGKTFKLNKKEYAKLSEHVGKFPVVLIAPNDVDIIRDGSEVRRKFFDSILCQLNADYMEMLVIYNRYLRQRNSSLKKFAQSGRVDYDLLQVYDKQLIPLAKDIYSLRYSFIEDFSNLFKKHYAVLTEQKEEVEIDYRSECSSEDYEKIYKMNLKKDIALERTTTGIHRDDYKLLIGQNPLKKFGSQGQQKTFIIALKMAHFEIIKQLKDIKPILLLDDIFDKLDSHRIQHLMQMVVNQTFGQIFITDAREERTKAVLNELNIPAQFYHIKHGMVK